jgi:hypothetical protein
VGWRLYGAGIHHSKALHLVRHEARSPHPCPEVRSAPLMGSRQHTLRACQRSSLLGVAKEGQRIHMRTHRGTPCAFQAVTGLRMCLVAASFATRGTAGSEVVWFAVNTNFPGQ